MALLEWGGKRVPVPAGEILLGSDADCAAQLSGPGVLPKHAVLKGMPDGQVVVRKAAPQAEVMINGVRLGAEPTPLLHGDKIEVGGHELTFVDERRSGSTQYIQAMGMPPALAAAAAEARAGRPTGNTGGRIVSLTDGREYAVTGSTLVFGREAGCDVVVPSKDVSRRHAEIVATPRGYLIVDSSTNGTFVNGERVEGQRVLARADVIAIGDETFRFYADAAAAPVPPAPAALAPAPPAPAPAGPPAAPPAAAAARLQNTMMGLPPGGPGVAGGGEARSSGAGAALASFLVRVGALHGQRLSIRTPVVNIGRADYNDLVLPDESVSTAHAKLQRREGVWVLVDLDSTNGSFVDGERVKGEAAIPPGATVRLGDVALVFEPTDDAAGVTKGGGTRLLEVMKPPAGAPAARPAPPSPTSLPSPAPKPAPRPRPAAKPAAPVKAKGKGCGASVVVFALGAAGVVYWLLV
jgi:pSer/pThr/pTyr-binding forkhead associated (FHA) protein